MKILIFIAVFCAALSGKAQQKDQPRDSIENNLLRLNSSTPVNLNSLLFILDDVEVTEASIRDIKPDDIQQINILKDSASTAAYGEKGRYGVILIELKKKKKKSDK